MRRGRAYEPLYEKRSKTYMATGTYREEPLGGGQWGIERDYLFQVRSGGCDRAERSIEWSVVKRAGTVLRLGIQNIMRVRALGRKVREKIEEEERLEGDPAGERALWEGMDGMEWSRSSGS